MAEFARIRVTPAEEEDIVILAGAVEEPAASAVGERGAEEALHEEAVAVEKAPSEASRAADGYRETTLDDLRRTRMSGMQKAILAVAIVAVLAFIIWYVLLR